MTESTAQELLKALKLNQQWLKKITVLLTNSETKDILKSGIERNQKLIDKAEREYRPEQRKLKKHYQRNLYQNEQESYGDKLEKLYEKHSEKLDELEEIRNEIDTLKKYY